MKKKILILAANPKDTARLALPQEARDIRAILDSTQYRDDFSVEHIGAVRPSDIQSELLRDPPPTIVHFSGHGEGEDGLVFENHAGESQLISAAALANLFKLFADRVQCVVLNACYSKFQAEAIAEHIPCVIGMNQAIGDKAALTFAEAFYKALGAGKSLEFAFEIACNAIELHNLPDNLTPVMLKKEETQVPQEELLLHGKRYALLIGPRYDPEEQEVEALRHTGDDVDSLRKLLKDENIGGFHQVASLKRELKEREIFKAISALFKQSEPEDLILLYFSGHVGIDSKKGWYFLDSETALDEFSLGKVSLDNIKKHCIMKHKAEHVVMLCDCLYHKEDQKPLDEQNLRQAFEELADAGSNRQIDILSTCAQTLEEKEGANNGLLTHYLVEGIASGLADVDKNGSTTLGELYNYACDAPRFQQDASDYPKPLKIGIHSASNIVIASTSDKPLLKSKYKHIADLLLKGDVIPFVGVEAFPLPFRKNLAREIADAFGLDEKTPPLSLLSLFYEIRDSRRGLYEKVKESLRKELENLEPQAIHHLLAHIEKPLFVISNSYDPFLEELFKAHDKKYILLTQLVNPLKKEHQGQVLLQYFHGKDKGESAAEVLPAERLVLKNPEEYSVIYKIRGRLNLQAQVNGLEEHDSLMISEKDYLAFAESFRIPEPLSYPLQSKMLLFLGCSMQNRDFRVLLHTILKDRRQLQRQPYAVRKTSDPLEISFWQRDKNIELIDVELPEFLNDLAEDMGVNVNDDSVTV